MADEITKTKDAVKVSDSKSAKDAKPAKDKKISFRKRTAKYFRDSKGEFKKIVWPTFPAVMRNTGVTLAMCIFVGVVVCLVDFGLGALIDAMLKLG